MKKVALFTVLSILFLGAGVHPIHVSVTEITFDEKEKELEIVSRIFLDDLEAAIRDSRKQPDLKLLEPGAGLSTEQLISAYILPRFKVSLQGHSQKLTYLGQETENEAVLCYIQVSNVKKLELIEIFNSIITELHDDQSNLVHVTVREKIKSLRLMSDKPSGTLQFEKK